MASAAFLSSCGTMIFLGHVYAVETHWLWLQSPNDERGGDFREAIWCGLGCMCAVVLRWLQLQWRMFPFCAVRMSPVQLVAWVSPSVAWYGGVVFGGGSVRICSYWCQMTAKTFSRGGLQKSYAPAVVSVEIRHVTTFARIQSLY